MSLTSRTPTLQGQTLVERLTALGEFLQRWSEVWPHSALEHDRLPWEPRFPALAEALTSLPEALVDELEAAPWRLVDRLPELPEPYAAVADEACRQVELDATAPAAPDPRLDDWRPARGIPGRKWRQIRAFAAALDAPERPGPLVDWCGGKGHLSRTLVWLRGGEQRVFELDAALCRDAERLAGKLGVACTGHACDVLEATPPLSADARVVALHACGALHIELIRRVSTERPQHLALAPCCYHRIQGQSLTPLSTTGRAAIPELPRAVLRLATTEQVRPSAKAVAARRRRIVWRLGLDALVRQATGRETFTPVGHYPWPLVKKPFAEFCRELAARNGLALPTRYDEAAVLAAARQRASEVRGLSLFRWLFRRPFELWLVLDRAAALQEAGYEVSVRPFCERRITPRNLLILARRQDS